jgi:glutamine synthetase
MLGSAASVADPNIVLNTAVAEVLRQFSEKLENVPAEEMDEAVHSLLKSTISEHKRIIFNGNGYTDEWIEEAAKRGLYNLKSTPDALPYYVHDKNVELFTSHKIFTKEELFSRYEIWLENYSKTINIESNTMAEMVQKDVLPAVFSYMEQLASTANLKKAVVADISTEAEGVLLKELTALAGDMLKGVDTLKADTAKALATEDALACAQAYQSQVLGDMETLRAAADKAETLLPEALLPYPTYDKLLFQV